MKNIILFLFMGSNKEILRSISTYMEVDNVLVYKSKQTGNWYKWEKSSEGRPVALAQEEREELLNNSSNKIINWGNHILHDQNNIVANKPSACKISSNKWLTRKIWQENNIKTPKSSDRWEDMIDFPFIARPYYHARQAEFNVINNLSDLSTLLTNIPANQENFGGNSWYFQKIVPKTCEFRVYVAGDKVLTIFWKGNGDQLLSSNREWHWFDDVNWDRSKLPHCINDLFISAQDAHTYPHIYGRDLNHVKEIINKIKEECIKATKALGLDYSGIDVGLDTETQEFNLFESNTDPELTLLPQQKFAKYFDSIFNQSISGNI